jgi:dCMP deaminase
MLSNIYSFKNTLTERLYWDEYFMSIALLASCRSPCERLKVGSVIVKDHRIISMGYNGFIAGAPHTSILTDGHEQATIHSEINAITDCAKRGVCLDDSVMYITHYPCINCFKCIASCGIKTIIYMDDYNNNSIVETLAEDAGILIVKLMKFL